MFHTGALWLNSSLRRRILVFMVRVSCAVLLIAAGLLAAHGQQVRPPVAPIESLIHSQQYDQALQTTKSGLKKVPSDFRLWTLEGIIFSIQGNHADALTAFDKALTLSPSYTPALKGEVQLLYQDGDLRTLPLLKRILKIDAKDQTAHEMLALLERQQGDCDAAIEHFAQSANVIQTHPHSLEAYGYCLVHLERFQEAIPVFERLTALLPDRTYPKYDLAVILAKTNQNEAALKTLEPLLANGQQDSDILSLASQVYEATGNTPKAVALLRQAIVLSPSTADLYIAFATLCLDHDSFQVGIDMINAGLRYIPDTAALYLSRGLLYAQLAQYESAEADFNRVEQLDAAQSLSSYAVDLADMQRNNPDQALARVRSQLKAHPDSPLLRGLLAQLLSNQTPALDSAEFKEAMESALLAVKMKPDLVGARDLLASMYMRSGQYSLAIDQCRLALKDAPFDETAAYHLVVALRHSGHGNDDEMKALVKRLSEMHQASLQHETDRKRYRLVEQETAPHK